LAEPWPAWRVVRDSERADATERFALPDRGTGRSSASL
jgi:hypothetical protein